MLNREIIPDKCCLKQGFGRVKLTHFHKPSTPIQALLESTFREFHPYETAPDCSKVLRIGTSYIKSYKI